jgi:hypothetical protein
LFRKKLRRAEKLITAAIRVKLEDFFLTASMAEVKKVYCSAVSAASRTKSCGLRDAG